MDWRLTSYGANSHRGLALWMGLLLVSPYLHGQALLSLTEASARQQDLTPAHEGEEIVVEGVVAWRPVPFGAYSQLPLRDKDGGVLTLEAPDFMFERLAPGDVIEVKGRLKQRDGMPVLQPAQLHMIGQEAAPLPESRRIEQLQNPKAVGLTVEVEGRVVAIGEDDGGSYLMLDEGQPEPYAVYLPKAATPMGSGLHRFLIGDRVRVTGVASQDAAEPPQAERYRLNIPSVSVVQLLEREEAVSPLLMLVFGVAVTLLVAQTGYRHYRSRELRRSVRRIHSLCEDLLNCGTREDLTRKLRTLGPRALDCTDIELFRYDRANQSLRRTLNPENGEAILVNLGQSSRSADHAVALCFRNRTALAIADARRSPLYWGVHRDAIPRSIVLLPALANEELTGVLQVASHRKRRQYPTEELLALQHLANQVAIVNKLIDGRIRKEQMMRSERLAATGQIISGVATELRQPLESIVNLAHHLMEHRSDQAARSIVNESLRVSAILSRYSQVAGRDEEEPTPIELNTLVEEITTASRKEIAPFNLTLDVGLAAQPLWVVGSAAQFETVLRNLIVLAARSARTTLDPRLSVEAGLRVRNVVVTIRYGSVLFDEFPQGENGEGLGFSVCRGILHGMGGDLKLARAGEGVCRMEIELPAAFPEDLAVHQPQRASSRTLTAVVLEPDPAEQRRLLSFWSRRGHRAMPIQDASEALELLRRLRIDVIFCAVRVGQGTWVEFFDSVRDQGPTFVLLAEGIDSDASELFPQSDGLVLRKPMEAGEFDRLLENIEQRSEMVETA